MDKVELMLRFVGYSGKALSEMGERELWRKAFSLADLIREMIEGLMQGVESGGPNIMPPTPPGFNPMDVYNNSSGPSLD